MLRSLSFAHNDAFTLAEVLITLVIIGVIAAITVPTLIAKYHKEQTITKLKKTYSSLAQTTARAVVDNGSIKTWEIGNTDDINAAIAFSDKYLIPYLNIMKKCETKTTDECEFKMKYLKNSSSYTNYDTKTTRFFLNDGTLVGVSLPNSHKNILISIDINGHKKPNTMGKDIFQFYYYTDPNPTVSMEGDYQAFFGKLLPDGYAYASDRNKLLNDSSYGCNKTANYGGTWCAALIMKDSWNPPDNYPW